MPKYISRHSVLFAIGVFGIVFYVLAPIIFPHVANLRQPELLPVYTLMLGLGQLIKGTEEAKDAAAPKEKNNNKGT